MSKAPYLAYLKNLREAPDKRAAMQTSPTKGLGGQRLAKADLAVYQDGPEEILAQLARDIKMPEETKMKLFESQRSNRALTTDNGTPITLDEANAMMEAEESAPPSGGLMSPAITAPLGYAVPYRATGNPYQDQRICLKRNQGLRTYNARWTIAKKAIHKKLAHSSPATCNQEDSAYNNRPHKTRTGQPNHPTRD
mgnify:CR=1 FL=1